MNEHDLIVIGGARRDFSQPARFQLGHKVLMINARPSSAAAASGRGPCPARPEQRGPFLEGLKKGKRYGVPVVEGARATTGRSSRARQDDALRCRSPGDARPQEAIDTLTGAASFRGPGRSTSVFLMARSARSRPQDDSSPPGPIRSPCRAFVDERPSFLPTT